MSSPFVKSKLKAARESIGKKDFGMAKSLADQVLEQEPDNYNGSVSHSPVGPTVGRRVNVRADSVGRLIGLSASCSLGWPT